MSPVCLGGQRGQQSPWILVSSTPTVKDLSRQSHNLTYATPIPTGLLDPNLRFRNTPCQDEAVCHL